MRLIGNLFLIDFMVEISLKEILQKKQKTMFIPKKSRNPEFFELVIKFERSFQYKMQIPLIG